MGADGITHETKAVERVKREENISWKQKGHILLISNDQISECDDGMAISMDATIHYIHWENSR